MRLLYTLILSIHRIFCIVTIHIQQLTVKIIQIQLWQYVCLKGGLGKKHVPIVKHAIASSMEPLKSALKHLWKPWEVGPAVKIRVRLGLPPMQQALCVCVSVS